MFYIYYRTYTIYYKKFVKNSSTIYVYILCMFYYKYRTCDQMFSGVYIYIYTIYVDRGPDW